MIKTFLVLYIFTIRQNVTNLLSLYIFFTLFNKLKDVFNVTGLLSSFCVHDEVKRDIHFNYITVHQMSLLVEYDLLSLRNRTDGHLLGLCIGKNLAM